MKKMMSLLAIASVLALGAPALAKNTKGAAHRPTVTRHVPRRTKKPSSAQKAAPKQGVAKGAKSGKGQGKGSKKVAAN